MLHNLNRRKLRWISLDLLFSSLVILLSFYTWRGILNQSIEGEGYYYFAPTNSLFPNGNLVNPFRTFDNFARLLTYILENTAQDNMKIYMLVVFVTILLINLTYYFSVKYITRNSLVALLAAIYVSINYASGFQLYARGHFQWYLQRVPEVILIFPAVALLVTFLKEFKYKYYFSSIILFFLALLVTHYSTLLLPIFVSLVTIKSIEKAKGNRKGMLFILLALPYVLINFLLIQETSLSSDVIRPNESVFSSWKDIVEMANKVSFQLVNVTVPLGVIKPFLNKVKDFTSLVNRLVIPTYVFYLFSFIYIYKKRKDYFTLIISFFLGLIGTLFLTAFIGRVNVYSDIFQGRYFYLPSFYVGLLLAVVITTMVESLTNSKKHFIRLSKYGILLTVVILWFALNSRLITKQISDTQHYYTANNHIMNVLKENLIKYPSDAIIFLPNPPLPGAENFLEKFYSKKEITYLYLDTNWFSKIPKEAKSERIFVLTYEKVPGVTYEDQVVIHDESEKYRILYKNLVKTN